MGVAHVSADDSRQRRISAVVIKKEGLPARRPDDTKPSRAAFALPAEAHWRDGGWRGSTGTVGAEPRSAPRHALEFRLVSVPDAYCVYQGAPSGFSENDPLKKIAGKLLLNRGNHNIFSVPELADGEIARLGFAWVSQPDHPRMADHSTYATATCRKPISSESTLLPRFIASAATRFT